MSTARKASHYFLSVAAVVELHAEAIRQFGGIEGVREGVLLESAVAVPQASFGGLERVEDPVEIAASYLFFLHRNRPFVDGSKRTALGACLLFLPLNGLAAAPDGPAWTELTFDGAASRLDRDPTIRRLRTMVKL